MSKLAIEQQGLDLNTEERLGSRIALALQYFNESLRGDCSTGWEIHSENKAWTDLFFLTLIKLFQQHSKYNQPISIQIQLIHHLTDIIWGQMVFGFLKPQPKIFAYILSQNS